MTTTHDVPMPEPRFTVHWHPYRCEYVINPGRPDGKPGYTADQLRAYADARCAKLQEEVEAARRTAEYWKANSNAANAEIDALAEKVKAMEADARRVFDLYPRHWDRVGGGLFVDESNVAEFDAAFEALGVRLGLLVEGNEGDAAIDAASGVSDEP